MTQDKTCTCLTCEHIKELTKLIPDDTLRNKVLEVTNELYERMASESMDLGMEVIKLKDEIEKRKLISQKKGKIVHMHRERITQLEDKITKLQSQLDNISEDKIREILEDFAMWWNDKKFNQIYEDTIDKYLLSALMKGE